MNDNELNAIQSLLLAIVLITITGLLAIRSCDIERSKLDLEKAKLNCVQDEK